MKVVVLDSLFESLDVEREAAATFGAGVERWDGDLASLADADVVAHVRTRVDAEMIAALRSCRAIARFGSGLDSVDLVAAHDAGIPVVSVRDYCTPELTSHTLALAFALSRRLQATAGDLESNWQQVAAGTPLSRRPEVAVIGLGSIGQSMAAALTALGFTVTAVTEHGRAAAARLGVEVAPLDAALGASDLVFLHCALGPTTALLIDDARCRLMRPDAILVNTARLGLIDQSAVAAALDERRLGGLALDAYLDESSPLRRFVGDQRVILTPHLGWYSDQSAAILRRRAIVNALTTAANDPNPKG